MRLSIVNHAKGSYPNNNDVLATRFLNISLYAGKAKKMGVGIVLYTWYISMLSC